MLPLEHQLDWQVALIVPSCRGPGRCRQQQQQQQNSSASAPLCGSVQRHLAIRIHCHGCFWRHFKQHLYCNF